MLCNCLSNCLNYIIYKESVSNLGFYLNIPTSLLHHIFILLYRDQEEQRRVYGEVIGAVAALPFNWLGEISSGMENFLQIS